jgi:uncharacterized membrane protein (DUF106 family)
MIGPLTAQIAAAAGDGTLFGVINDKIAEAKIALGGAGTAVVLGFFIYSIVKKGFAFGAMLIAGLVAGLCLYIMKSGMTDMENMWHKEVSNSGIHQIGPAPSSQTIPHVRRGA